MHLQPLFLETDGEWECKESICQLKCGLHLEEDFILICKKTGWRLKATVHYNYSSFRKKNNILQLLPLKKYKNYFKDLKGPEPLNYTVKVLLKNMMDFMNWSNNE